MDKVYFKIIIPNYNCFPYIRQCLDSILNQTFQDFKIIFVDDMSTDKSVRLVETYQRKYPNKIVLIKETQKRFAGGCRNDGIDYPLDCQYYMFVDSDDTLNGNNALKELYDASQDLENQIIFYDYLNNINGRIIRYKPYDFDIQTYDIHTGTYNACWSRIIRHDCIQKFLECCMFGEDTYQLMKQLQIVSSYKHIHIPLYVYNVRQHSVSHNNSIYSVSYMSRRIFLNAIRDMLYDNNCKQSLKRTIQTRLSREDANEIDNYSKSGIPKIIHMIWIGKSEPIYKDKVIEMYKQINPEFDIHYVHCKDVKNSTDPDIKSCLCEIRKRGTIYNMIFNSPAFQNKQYKYQKVFNTAFSDTFRTFLLNKYGGIYVDIDTVPVKPFDNLLLSYKYFQCQAKWGKIQKPQPDLYFMGCIKGVLCYPPFLLKQNNIKLKPHLLSVDDYPALYKANRELSYKLNTNTIQLGEYYRCGDDVYINHLNRKLEFGIDGWFRYVKM